MSGKELSPRRIYEPPSQSLLRGIQTLGFQLSKSSPYSLDVLSQIRIWSKTNESKNNRGPLLKITIDIGNPTPDTYDRFCEPQNAQVLDPLFFLKVFHLHRETGKLFIESRTNGERYVGTLPADEELERSLSRVDSREANHLFSVLEVLATGGVPSKELVMSL